VDQIIRWAGSKRQIVRKLADFWQPSYSRYIEPFCGSACLFFHLEPEVAILGDMNRELITTYKALAGDAEGVCSALRLLRRGFVEYYRIRSRRPDYRRPADVAARFLYLNRYCFNGIYRTNGAGHFNVPYGPQKRYARFSYRELKSKANALRGATFHCQDFEATLDQARSGDFVYLDPPYAVENRRVFAQYQAAPFNSRDLKRLTGCLEQLDRHDIAFVVSYADCSEARTAFKKWRPTRVRVQRHIAGFASHRRVAYEVLASNVE
jgi:DNA adenine methylase